MSNKAITPEYIWSDGAVVRWEDARIHVWTDALCGINVFEGLRGYWRPSDERHHVLHLDRHLHRLLGSLKAARIPCPYAADDFAKGIGELLAALGYREHVYLRPTVLLEKGKYSTDPGEVRTRAFIPIFPVPATSARAGVHCTVSSWRRPSDLAMPPRIKAGANYYNLRLARLEAADRGADEPILLGEDGKVAETGGASVFLVRDGRIITPPVTASILESITRDTVLTLARADLGYETLERPVDRTELYAADEVFLTGTLCEIAPVLSVDGIPVRGRAGPVTAALQETYQKICAGDGGHQDWLTPGPTGPVTA
ncbi:aminotransferase class IV [Actinomadura rubrisoli]|uniref:Branched-chain-amino-acid transaminase n=1 Tax=Actinomadura rubrisoli TaxID=2530368 RepID=A0A4R5CA75_9ACTN|nr:aminotransferase class IV [Actinomadura rubrisoli]TDD96798.1 branched-chain-amino-acid transaminase [Actinomadura rubrisoli]